MELSLDDIIKTTPGMKKRGGGVGGRGRGRMTGGRGGKMTGGGGLRRSFGPGRGGARGGARFSTGGVRLGRVSVK